jgi:pSer/pThr/pTyr-binding forkhead associated (FHA) protein
MPMSVTAVRCPTCGTTNPAMYRFCVACGVTLPREGAKPAAPAAPAPAAPAPVERSPIPAPVERSPIPGSSKGAPARLTEPSAPSPVPVERAQPPAAMQQPLATPAPTPAPAPAPAAPQAVRQDERIIGAPVVEIAPGGVPQKPIICPRCQGQCIPTARFCQFCGGPIGEGRASLGARVELDSSPVPRELAANAWTDGRPAASPGPLVVAHGRGQASQGRGRLVVIEADGSEGMTFALAERPLDIGRTEGDILVKEDPYVSPRHARLVPDGGRWLVRDLSSTNGVYLRVKKPHALQDADLLLLGQEVLQFQLVSEPEKGLGHASQHGTLLFGSPITSRSARLCQRTVEGITRDVYYLHRDETIIGRESGDIVFTADPFLSRRHAVIRRSLARKDGAARSGSRWDFTLTDLDSSNGTFVAIRGEVVLSHGDFVRVGQHLFRVDFA